MKYDVIVIGAGTNGLTAAGLLAKAGKCVLVLEQRGHCGGLAGSEEFAPGYRLPGVLHDTSGVRHQLIGGLALQRHGLELQSAPAAVYAAGGNGPGLLLHHDAEKAAKDIEAFSKRDAQAYAGFRQFIARVRGVVNNVLDDIPLDATEMSRGELLRGIRKGAALRRLGRRRMLELLRVGPMSVADWLGEWFESDLLKSVLAAPAVQGSFLGPRSPGSATNLLVYECRKGPSIKGGAGALVAALEKSAVAYGAEIRTGATVERIRVGKKGIEGVTLAGGEAIDASLVASTCDPQQTFLRLLDGARIDDTFEHRIRKYRSDGTTAKVNLAVDSRATFAERIGDAEIVRTGVHLDDTEKAFDAIKYGHYSERPVLDVYAPSPDGSAPDGHGGMSVLVNYAPYHLRDSWSDEHRAEIGRRAVAALDELAPGTAGAVKHIEILTPPDIEARYRLTGGHIYHGDHQLDQILCRPSPECAQYATPIKGLFVCGSGNYPGGGITCAPGALGARTILASR